MTCKNIKDLLNAEIPFIEKHINDHKWFRGIENYEEGIKDFVDKYGAVFKQFYCNYVCSDNQGCELGDISKDDSHSFGYDVLSVSKKCSHLGEQIDAELAIIEKNIEKFKRETHIANDSAAVKEFIKRYGFIMEELYCGSVCGDRGNCEYQTTQKQ